MEKNTDRSRGVGWDCCMRVLTTSNGCNKTQLAAPEKAPANKSAWTIQQFKE